MWRVPTIVWHPSNRKKGEQNAHLEEIVQVLGEYFPLENMLYNQKREMQHTMCKPWELKVQRYVSWMMDIAKYIHFFPGGDATKKLEDMDLRNIILHSDLNSWANQAYLQGFELEAETCCTKINIFKRCDIIEDIHKGSWGKKSKKPWGKLLTMWVPTGIIREDNLPQQPTPQRNML